MRIIRAAPRRRSLEMDTEDFAVRSQDRMPGLLLWGANGGVGRNQQTGACRDLARYATNIVGAKAVPMRALPVRGGAGADDRRATRVFRRSLIGRVGGRGKKSFSASTTADAGAAVARAVRGLRQDDELTVAVRKVGRNSADRHWFNCHRIHRATSGPATSSFWGRRSASSQPCRNTCRWDRSPNFNSSAMIASATAGS